MNRLNRVLSLLICFAMVVISIPGIALVSADDNFATEFVIIDNTEYASFDDATNWSFPGSEYADVDVDEEENDEIMYQSLILGNVAILNSKKSMQNARINP